MAASIAQQLTAEFVGTFLLIFTVGCNVLSNSGLWAGVSIACVLMVCIYSFGGISGANFNPAVSVGLGLSKTLGGNGMEWGTVGLYCVTQILAGITAGLAYTGLFGHPFNLQPNKGFGAVEAGLVEMIYTFMLVFVVLNVAAAKKFNESGPPQWFGLAIGFVVIAGAYGAGAISGGCFNPAVAFGIDVSSAWLGFGWCLWYTVAEVVGAVLAVLLFSMVRPGDFGRETSEDSLMPLCLSEFLGTFMLVLTVGLNVLAKSPAAAFSIAASLMCMIYALGDVSGAHFNPAVTLAITIYQGTGSSELFARMGVQILGGVAAAMTYTGLYDWKNFALGPGVGYNWYQVGVAETFFTFVLCLVVLCTAVSKKTKAEVMFGLAIGSCVTVGGFAIGGISGGSLNPAVSTGIETAAFVAKHGNLATLFKYYAFEFAGAGLAAGLVKLTHADSEDKDAQSLTP